MRKFIVLSVVVSVACLLPIPRGASSVACAAEASQPQDQYQDAGSYEPYTPEQLDNLLAPIALYPDPLLAQVLLAATFPDQVQDAAIWMQTNRPDSIDYQSWDVSVKAVAHYPTVLAMLNDRLDWTTALGQAYAYQSTDIMMSVQRLRNMAYSQGNLVSTPQQQVIVSGGYIQIFPAQPRMIFVPAYDPGVIYVRRVYRPGIGFGGFFTFGSGFMIGAWLNYDMDWGSHYIIYNDWRTDRGGWRGRSRPYVRVTNVYVNNRYEHVNVNRTVVNRHVDYNNVRGYNSVHRDVNFENRARIESNRDRNQTPRGGQQPPSQPPNGRANDRGNDRGNRNRPPIQGQPAQPQRPNNNNVSRPNQAPPPNVEQQRTQPPSGNVNPQQTQRPNDNNVRRPNQVPPPNAEQQRPQPPSGNVNPQQIQRPNDNNVRRPNQAPPPNTEQQRPQPPNGNMNDRGNNRGDRNQPQARPEQPVRTAPQSRPQAAPTAPPAPRPSTENQPKVQQQQHDNGTKNKGNENKSKGNESKGKDNGGDKK